MTSGNEGERREGGRRQKRGGGGRFARGVRLDAGIANEERETDNAADEDDEVDGGDEGVEGGVAVQREGEQHLAVAAVEDALGAEEEGDDVCDETGVLPTRLPVEVVLGVGVEDGGVLRLQQLNVPVVDARVPGEGVLNQFVAAVEVVVEVGELSVRVGVVEELGAEGGES
mgnify:CR=1 FL=1